MKNYFILLSVLAYCIICCSAVLSPGDACTADEECPKYHICEDAVCTHKDLFPDATSEEFGGVFVSIIANSLSNAGGMGAGGLLVPYLSLMNNFTPNSGIILSYAIVFGGSIGALLCVIFKKNHVTGGPLIVYNIDMLCIPLLLAGVPIGVLLNKILAPIVVTCLLYCLLIFGIYKIGQNFLRNFRKERELAREAKALKEKQPATLGTEAQGPLAIENEQLANEIAVVSEESPAADELEVKETLVDLEKPNSEETPLEKKVLEVEEDPQEPQSTQIIHTEEPKGRKSHRVWVHQKHGDIDDVEDELYELGFNTVMAFMAVSDPEKVVEENREIERRHALMRKQSLELQEKVNPQEKELENAQTQFSEADKLLAEKIRKRELRQFPLEKIGVLLLALAIYVIMNILMGNAKFESVTGNIEYCSGGYWGLWIALIILEICVYFLAAFLVLRQNREKERIGWEFRPEDVKLDAKGAAVLLGLGFFAGMLGGILALGGGLILAPFFLGKRVPPQPLAASTCIFIVFSQFSTLIISILAGSYTAKDLLFLLFISAAFSFLFSRGVNWFVHKTKKQSIILGILTVILCIAFIANVAAMSVNLRDNKTFMTTFVSYC